jgi:NhaP-type Na+/H+ or K+/H+ antiporter
MPMLRQIRPKGRVNHVLKWEGIVNDPVGAVLAVIILEIIVVGRMAEAPGMLAWGIAKTLLIGIVFSVAGGYVLVVAFRRHWVPDFLHNPVTLAVVLATFVISNSLQKESGLLTVTLMGCLLANQKSFPIRHIIEFKENLQVLLIAGLFVVLSARVEAEVLREVGLPSLLFVLTMILVVRPASVLASTAGTPLNWRERIFLMVMAPRGIVVTALASLFAFSLAQEGDGLGERMFAETLFVVIGTVSVYGLAAGPVARLLGIGNANPTGVLMVGAQPFARMIGVALKKQGVGVALIDSNEGNIKLSEEAGLTAYCGNIHSEEFLEGIDFSNIGKILAVTPNDEINAFAQQELSKFVGRANAFALPQRSSSKVSNDSRESSDRGADLLFGKEATFGRLAEAFYRGAVVKAVTVSADTAWRDLRDKQNIRGRPLFLIREDKSVQVHTRLRPIETIRKGNTLLFLTEPINTEEPT